MGNSQVQFSKPVEPQIGIGITSDDIVFSGVVEGINYFVYKVHDDNKQEIANMLDKERSEYFDVMLHRDPIHDRIAQFLEVPKDVMLETYRSKNHTPYVQKFTRQELKQMVLRAEEQRCFVEGDSSVQCDTWYIKAVYRDESYGGIFVFYSPEVDGHEPGSKFILIQGVTKYPVLAGAAELYPEKSMPKLNTVLHAGIMQIARSIPVDFVYVKPINRQGEYLKKYYGYQDLNFEFQSPDKKISKSMSNEKCYRRVKDFMT